MSFRDRRSSVAKHRCSILLLIVPIALFVFFISLSMTLISLHNTTGEEASSSSSSLLNEDVRRLRFQGTTTTTNEESIDLLRQRLPPSVWTMAGRNSDPEVAKIVSEQLLNDTEKQQGLQLCGKFLYSTIERAVQVGDMGEQTFVATGDIDSMWTRDSAVQMGIYMGRIASPMMSKAKGEPAGQPYLRPIIEGAIRRQAFNIIQDPYANAYARQWRDPAKLELKEQVIGRGGWVDTRNYELDSGAYFLTQLYDYYVAEHLYRPEVLLAEPLIFDAVMLMVETIVVEQNHETDSPYRYFELPEQGKGLKTGYTGMSWSGFRPSDDKCQYGYLVPANMHAAAGLERILELNKRIWKSDDLDTVTIKLLGDMEEGIRKYGVLEVPARSGKGMELIYAYEVDGLGNFLKDFDDANVPSLLSIPLLGWSGYDAQIYNNTRARLLDPKFNKHYFKGDALQGMGSPHTPTGYVWSLAMSIEALTSKGTPEHRAQVMAFQVRQSLKSACHGAMHESVHAMRGCPVFTRPWFEWANAMFVVLMETALGQRCDPQGQKDFQKASADNAIKKLPKNANPQTMFFENKFHNDHTHAEFYLGIESKVKYVE